MDEILARVSKVARVGVVVAGTRRGVEIRGLDGVVGGAASAGQAGGDALGRVLVDGVLGGGCVLAVTLAGARGVAEDAADAVVGAVLEVHVGVVDLVVVAAPAVEDVAGVGVEVNEPADLRVGVEHPLDGLGLGFAEGGCTVVGLGAGGRGPDAGLDAAGEEGLEVPEEVEVAVQVHADGARGRVAVLAPAAVGGLVVRSAVRVAVGHDDDARRQSSLDLSGRVRLGAVRKSDIVLVGIEQVGNEVEDVVHGSTLARMDVAVEVDAVGVVASSRASNLGSNDGVAVVGSVGGGEGGDAVGVDQTFQTALDLIDIEQGAERGGLGPESSGGNGTAAESIARADRSAGR